MIRKYKNLIPKVPATMKEEELPNFGTPVFPNKVF